jgi:creatinine amidohydrolase
MRFEDLHWMDVEAYLKTDDRVILITGATEQHAYLSLLTDILIPSRVALAVAERKRVLIAPPLNFGISEFFSSFPGTISLTKQTFDTVLVEIVQSLLYQDFGGFFILNGHGGNTLPAILEDMRLEGHARIAWYDWWRSPVVAAFGQEHSLQLDHANWGENFPFNRVAESPSGIKPVVNLGYLADGQSVRDVLGDGSYGGPYQVDDALMNDLFARVVDEASDLLDTLTKPLAD